jgi:oxygen-independent coproporphyrinogen-3 oxidase
LGNSSLPDRHGRGASLYVHIPLCLKKCDYCDFFSLVPGAFPSGCRELSDITASIVDGLAREIDAWRAEYGFTSWKTVYIGGGTPSLLSVNDIERLGCAIRGPDASRNPTIAEWTIEANPEDIGEAWLASCARAGINRLSIGVQSLDDACLTAVGRRGCSEKTIEALELVSRAWKGRLSLDLIAGLPGQSARGLIADLERLLPYQPDHLSLYSLTVEEGTPLAKRRYASTGVTLPLPDEDEAAEIWLAGRDWLEAHGFAQYEVSNFAKGGHESLHNMTYWKLDTYIGIGPGATGTIVSGDEAVRFTNTKDFASWLADPRVGRTIECISRKELMSEVLLMGMRLREGIVKCTFSERFGTDLASCIPRTIASWAARGLVIDKPDRLALTKEGLLFLNRFLLDAFDEL